MSADIILGFLEQLHAALHDEDEAPLASIAGLTPITELIQQISRLTKTVKKNGEDQSFIMMIQHDFVLCYMNHYPSLHRGVIKDRKIHITLGSSFQKPVEQFRLDLGEVIRYVDHHDVMGDDLGVKMTQHFLDTCLSLLDQMAEQIDDVVELEDRLPRATHQHHAPPNIQHMLAQLNQPEVMRSIQDFASSGQLESLAKTVLSNGSIADTLSEITGENAGEKISGLLESFKGQEEDKSSEEEQE